MQIPPAILLPVRIAQAALALILLGLTAWIANVSAGFISQDNFLVFVSLWTMLVVAFVVVVPRVAASVGHPIILLALDAVTMLFWFAGFIALAVYITGPFYNVSGCNLSYCHGLRAIVVFGVFEWLLFCLTTVASLLLLVSGSKGTATTTTTTQGVAA